MLVSRLFAVLSQTVRYIGLQCKGNILIERKSRIISFNFSLSLVWFRFVEVSCVVSLKLLVVYSVVLLTLLGVGTKRRELVKCKILAELSIHVSLYGYALDCFYFPKPLIYKLHLQIIRNFVSFLFLSKHRLFNLLMFQTSY